MSTSTTKSAEELKNSKVGTAVGESSCQKPVAIYPVRYAVVPSSKGSGESFKYLSSKLDKNLPTLDNAKYVLRTLRPESYVYVYNENAEIKLTCFFYSKEHQGTSTPRFYYIADVGGAAIILPTAFDYIWTDCNKSKTFSQDIKIGYTDAPPSQRTCANLIKDAALREKLLPTTVAVNTWQGAIKKVVDAGNLSDVHNHFPDAHDPKIKNTFFPSTISLQTHITDFQGTDLEWSESLKNKNHIGIIKSGMQIANSKEQIAVALYDPIGITSELNNIVADNYNKFQDYVNSEAHAVASANSLIKFFSNKNSGEQLKSAIKAETERTADQNIGIYSRIDASATAIEMRAKEKLQKEIFNYESQLRTDKAGLQAHINNYQKTLAHKDKGLKSTSADAMVWAPSISPSLKSAPQPALQGSQSIADALQFYDRVMFGDETYDDDDYLSNFAAYGFAIYRILGSLPMIKEGQKLVGELIAGEVSQNPYWIALGKRRETQNAQDTAWNHMKNPTDGVFALLVTAVGAGHISNKQIEFNTRSLIRLMNSTMDHWYNKKEGIKRRLNAFVPKSEVTNFLKSTPKINTLTQIKENRKAVQSFNKRQAVNLRALANPKIYGPFTAVIAVIAIIDFRDTFSDYKTGEKGDYEGITAVSSGFGATSAILITSGVAFEVADKMRGKEHFLIIAGKRVETAKLLGGMGGVVGGFGAFSGSLKDGADAFNLFDKGDNDSAAFTAAASVAGFLNAGATGAVGLIGISQAFGGAALGGLVATEGAALTVLGATAFAWATLGLGLFVGVLILAYLAADAKDKPIEIWLQQTYWGIKPRYKSITEEIDAMNNLMYRPAVEAEWNDISNIENASFNSADELILQITLPYYTQGKSKFELRENISLNGQELSKVRSRYDLNKKDNKAYTMRTKLIETGNGYAKYEAIIILDDDAKATVTLDYYPDTENHPNMKISGHPTGKAWAFKDDGLFSDTIDDDEFNNRVDDRR